TATLVGHDLGGIVAYAYAARYPGKVTRLAFLEAPIPGVGPWEEVKAVPALWHWNFGGPDAERLVAGRERIYLDHFWNAFAVDPSKIGDEVRDHYAAQYAAPGGMRAAFAQFAAFAEDARQNEGADGRKLTIPVLAVGAEHAFGPYPAMFMRSVATDVRAVVIPGTGHWLMEENPDATVALLRDFIDGE
ncbi:MAG TPA: alpha/beta hydrolase, partial [Inquilinus sp.]